MRKYWSCGKFADWLRGTPKLDAGTSKEWHQWRTACKEKNPIRYWMVEEGLDDIQDFIMWPLDKLYAIKYWLVNRFSTTHALTSSLKRGQWHEFDERMLHCLFDELVNFVEIEQAWHHVIFSEEAYKKYKTPWYASGWFRLRTWRCPEAGLDYLNWASQLVFDDTYCFDNTHPDFGKPTHQAICAKETIELYNWWKFVRPTRGDANDISGWSEYCELRRQRNPDYWWDDVEDKTEEEKTYSRSILINLRDIEKYYDDQDEEMLIRLIKIRRGLWT